MPKMSVWPSSVMQLKHGANGTLLNFLSSTRVVPSTTSFELLRRCITSFAFVNDAIFISLYISDISWQYLEDCLKFCLAFVWPFFFFLFYSILSGFYRLFFYFFYSIPWRNFFHILMLPKAFRLFVSIIHSPKKVLHLEAGRGGK